MPLERYEFPLKEIGRFLLKHQGITEGHWELGINFDVAAVNTSKPDDESMLPSVLVRVRALALRRVESKTPTSISPEDRADSPTD